jgi:hypothetical protein
MKQRLFIFFTLLFFSCDAQVPGYMGRRLITSYSNYFMFGADGPTARKSGSGFNFTHVLGAEYLVKGNKAIGFAAQFVHTGVEYKYIKYNFKERDPLILNNWAFALSLKRYGKNRIAPLGAYIKFEALFSRYTAKYDKDGFKIQDHSNWWQTTYYSVDAGTGEIKFNGIGGAFSIGRQRILFHRLVLDYGARGSIMFPLLHKFNTDIERSIYSQSGYRFLGHQFINLKVGIGFLAF